MTPSWTTNGRREEETQGNGKDAKLKKDVDDYDNDDDKDNHGELNRNQQLGKERDENSHEKAFVCYW